MSFNSKVISEHESIHGRKININGEGIRVEDLVSIQGVPSVILSNDETIPLMEALNYPLWEAPASGNNIESSSGGLHFPTVEYDEDGIPINLSNIAVSEEEMLKVDISLNGPGTKPLAVSLPRLAQSPLKTLLEGAKKENREFTLTFTMKVVNPNLYVVLKESYPDEDIDNIIASMLAADIITDLVDTIKRSMTEILNSPIKPENDTEKEKNNTAS